MNNSTEFAACFKQLETNSWNCKCDFKTSQDADDYIQDIKTDKKNICYVIVEYNKIVPDFLKQFYLRKKLTPSVKILK